MRLLRSPAPYARGLVVLSRRSLGLAAHATRSLPSDSKRMKKLLSDKPDPLSFNEKIQWVAGVVILASLLPLVGVVVGSAVLWDAIDRGFMGRPLDGILMSTARWFNRATASFNSRFVKHKEDAYLVNTLWLLGIFIPCLFALSLKYTLDNGFSFFLCYLYHLVRIGPYFMNFAYVYTLCHKEGHTKMGLFKGALNKPLMNVYNWWIGLFYGVMPSSFAYGHSINHHKYNNGPKDVVTTADKPRDSFRNFVAYIPRWAGYAVNITTVVQFVKERNYKVAGNMLLGSLYWACFASFIWHIDPQFAFWYVVFPMGENILLLACINWCWHAFLDSKNPLDEYVGSVTIFDGPINVLNEDFHVVHHQYPGAHWTNHPNLYEKHYQKGEYTKRRATVFKNTHAFELFFLIILREYKVMAEKFIDLKGGLTEQDKINLIKERLRTCSWGHRFNLQRARQEGE